MNLLRVLTCLLHDIKRLVISGCNKEGCVNRNSKWGSPQAESKCVPHSTRQSFTETKPTSIANGWKTVTEVEEINPIYATNAMQEAR